MAATQCIHFTAENFGATFACLGEQVARVVQAVAKTRTSLTWYGADILPTGIVAPHLSEGMPTLIGNTEQLVSICSKVDQFSSGVFLAIDSSILQPRFRAGGVNTEDDEDAGTQLGDCLVEVRAFDFSYIAVLSKDSRLLLDIRDCVSSDR